MCSDRGAILLRGVRFMSIAEIVVFMLTFMGIPFIGGFAIGYGLGQQRGFERGHDKRIKYRVHGDGVAKVKASALVNHPNFKRSMEYAKKLRETCSVGENS